MIILSTLKKVLFWSYERGTWPYDVMCVLILAFIFLSPNGIFKSASRASASPIFVAAADIEIATTDPARVAEEIRRHLSQREGYEVAVSGIELVLDESGKLKGYRVWKK